MNPQNDIWWYVRRAMENLVIGIMGREIHSRTISGIIICARLRFLILAVLRLLGSFQPIQVGINKLSAEAGQSVRDRTRPASSEARAGKRGCRKKPIPSKQWNDSLESPMFLPDWNKGYGNEFRRAIAFGA